MRKERSEEFTSLYVRPHFLRACGVSLRLEPLSLGKRGGRWAVYSHRDGLRRGILVKHGKGQYSAHRRGLNARPQLHPTPRAALASLVGQRSLAGMLAA